MVRWLAVSVLVLALLAPRPSHAGGVPIAKASKEQLKAAQRTFEAADGLFDAKRYQEAITAYRASYEIVASPNSRLMIARSLAHLNRLDEAHAELVGAVADAKEAAAADDKYAPTLKAAEAELSQLEPKVGRVEIVLGAALSEAKVSIGTRAFGPSELGAPLVVTPGKVTVVATLADGRTARREVSVAAGATEKVQLDLEAAPKEEVAPAPAAAPAPAPQARSEEHAGPSRTYAYVAAGVGVAGFATFAAFGLMNKSKFDELESSCTGGHCGPGRQDDIDSGKRYQTIANIGLGVGIVGLAAGTTLFLLSSPKKREGARLELRLAPGHASLGGRFQ